MNRSVINNTYLFEKKNILDKRLFIVTKIENQIFFLKPSICSLTSRSCTCPLTITQYLGITFGYVPKMQMGICTCGFDFASVAVPVCSCANKSLNLIAAL